MAIEVDHQLVEAQHEAFFVSEAALDLPFFEKDPARVLGVLTADEPELQQYIRFDSLHGPGTTARHALNSAIFHSQKWQVKTQLVETAIRVDLSHHDSVSAVKTLVSANAAELLQLHQYREPFVLDQYESCLLQDDALAANIIATTMLTKGDKVIRPIIRVEESGERSDITLEVLKDKWTPLEQKSFQAHARYVLNQNPPSERMLSHLADNFKFRELTSTEHAMLLELNRKLAAFKMPLVYPEKIVFPIPIELEHEGMPKQLGDEPKIVSPILLESPMVRPKQHYPKDTIVLN